MTDVRGFGEKSAVFFSGLNLAQLAGRERFEVQERYLEMRISQKSSFEDRAAHALDATDKMAPVGNTERMTDMNREELDAKLSAVEARMDRRISEFGADMRQVVSDFRLEMAPMKNIKTSIWSAAGFIVASMIAVIGLTVTGFYTGRDTSNLINEAKTQAQETRKLLEQIKAQQLAPTIPSADPPHKN